MVAWENSFTCPAADFCSKTVHSPLLDEGPDKWATVQLHIVTLPENGGRCLMITREHDSLRPDMFLIKDGLHDMSCDERGKLLQLHHPGGVRKIRFRDISEYWCFLVHYASGRIISRNVEEPAAVQNE